MQTGASYYADLDDALAVLERCEAEKARTEAAIVDAVNEIKILTERAYAGHQTLPARRGSGESITGTIAASQIACLLRIPERTAQRLLHQAHILSQRHCATLESLREGEISWRHTTLLLHEYDALPDSTAGEVEKKLLPIARECSTNKLAYHARKLRTALHPDCLDDRARTAHARRRVDVEPADDAMAWLEIYLPATDAAAIDARLTHAARALRTAGEVRTLTQLRVDVLTDLLTQQTPARARTSMDDDAPGGGSDDASDSSATSGIRAHINVTVPVLTLLGVDDAPADLEGYGPIPAEIARRLATHAPSFTRILTHPETGAVLSVGRTTYSVPADLKKWLRVRDRTCRHPGCIVPASRCEIDHTRPWSHDGTTDHLNLALLCGRHHMLKSEGIWHYQQPAPGVLTATSPAGRTYTTTPDPPPF